ncbi:MAG: hypothetical protein WC575_03645 [Patescibacteria group bacterium]
MEIVYLFFVSVGALAVAVFGVGRQIKRGIPGTPFTDNFTKSIIKSLF